MLFCSCFLLCSLRLFVADLVLREYSTSTVLPPRTLAREMVRLETQFGLIDVKVTHINSNATNGAANAMPEFEQCRAAAKQAGVPLRKVLEAAPAAYLVHNAKG